MHNGHHENSGATISPQHFDAIIVGAGFSGLYQLYRLRGIGMTVRVLEAGDGVGGTWYWNRYPGARCDVESIEYSFSFSKELQDDWEWSERYAGQAEILRYLNHVADRFDLRRDIQFNTRVAAAHYHEQHNHWRITTQAGEQVTATYCIMATGCLSAARLPDIEGRESFQGRMYHTGAWPHEGVDFSGQRVAVIGTGSSAIQSIPVIAEQAAQLYVFQRTPNYSIPARNYPLTPEYKRAVKAHYEEIRRTARESAFGVCFDPRDDAALAVSHEERMAEYERRWQKGGLSFLTAFNDLLISDEANATAAEFVRQKIREIVKDPQVAEDLAPKDYPIGTKRICADTNYFETFNRDNVTLINLRKHPIEAITPTGIRTTSGEYAVDAIVFATGFDAMTGALAKIDIRGRSGEALRDQWAAGPRTYLGLMSAGFPNMFMITGPGSPSVLSNMVVSIEQHVDWVTDCITYLHEHDLQIIEPTREAQDAWVDHVNEVASYTLFPKAASWYMGANIPGKPRIFMPYAGGVHAYAQRCSEVAAKGYEGFLLQAHAAGSLAATA